MIVCCCKGNIKLWYIDSDDDNDFPAWNNSDMRKFEYTNSLDYSGGMLRFESSDWHFLDSIHKVNTTH